MGLGWWIGICNWYCGELWRGLLRGRVRHVDEQDVLAGVVDGDVLMGLEEAQFADALGGDAAGGEVGDGSGGEFDADVGDVDARGEDGQAYGADFRDR